MSNTCVYCLSEGGPFTAEHVVPQAFGKFNDNLVLNSEVCGDCNQHFGNTLDIILARGSHFGMMRYILGMRSPLDLNRSDQSRVQITVEDELVPLPVKFIRTEENDVMATYQAGIVYWSIVESNWRFASLTGILAGHERLADLDRTQLVTIISLPMDNITPLRDALERLGLELEVVVTYKEESDKPGVRALNVDVLEDEVVRRGIAKISFNYLTKIRGADFVLSDRFNRVRRYIRYGEQSGDRFVVQAESLTIIEGTFFPKIRHGHMLSFDTTRDCKIVGRVTLFGDLQYHVFLGEAGPILTLPIAAGHYFDVQDGKTAKMSVVQRPPGLWLPNLK